MWVTIKSRSDGPTSWVSDCGRMGKIVSIRVARVHHRYRSREQRKCLLDALAAQNGEWVEVATVPGVSQPGLIASDLLKLDLIETRREGKRRQSKLFARITMWGRHALARNRLEYKDFSTAINLRQDVYLALSEIAGELGIVHTRNRFGLKGKPKVSDLLRTIAERRDGFIRWYRNYVPNE